MTNWWRRSHNKSDLGRERYVLDQHRFHNKAARVRSSNGEAYFTQWVATYAASSAALAARFAKDIQARAELELERTTAAVVRVADYAQFGEDSHKRHWRSSIFNGHAPLWNADCTQLVGYASHEWMHELTPTKGLFRDQCATCGRIMWVAAPRLHADPPPPPRLYRPYHDSALRMMRARDRARARARGRQSYRRPAPLRTPNPHPAEVYDALDALYGHEYYYE